MKSIMEEASSVAKAIEKAWTRAGKPQEFTIKVFEEAQKNFIGMTLKSAKIGIFFEDQIQAQPKSGKFGPIKKSPQSIKQSIPAAQQQKQQIPQPKHERQQHRLESPWNPELCDAASAWVRESLNLMGLKNVDFTTEVDRFALKIRFKSLLNNDPEKEKMLFRSWAYLIMQALRQKFKRPLKGLKIILMSAA